MRLGLVKTISLLGLEGYVVEVETQVRQGIPGIHVVGLPDTALREARERVRGALFTCGIKWPPQRLTVNLSPASLHKGGTNLDLAFAISICVALKVVAQPKDDEIFLGELRLDGRLQPVRGIIPLVLQAAMFGIKKVYLPAGNYSEAALVPGVTIYPCAHLADVLNALGAKISIPVDPLPIVRKVNKVINSPVQTDLADYAGNPHGRYALEVAAAGGHHMLMLGPPGCGKTLISSLLPNILPPLSSQEALEVSSIHSLAGTIDVSAGLIDKPPYQNPHHSISGPALVGSMVGGILRPGVISLAHRGVLFLDELPEFSPACLQNLRQPLESGIMQVQRARASATLPAAFQLLGASNYCLCGGWGLRGSKCTCKADARDRYIGRIGGPILDRMDVMVKMRPPTRAELAGVGKNDTTEVVKSRIAQARLAMRERLRDYGFSRNSDIPGSLLRQSLLKPRLEAMREINMAYDRGILTMRAVDRVIRVSWSIADLSGLTTPDKSCVEAAIQIRKVW